MAGFIEFNVICPKCKEETGVLDIGKIYEEYHCTNTKCGISKTQKIKALSSNWQDITLSR